MKGGGRILTMLNAVQRKDLVRHCTDTAASSGFYRRLYGMGPHEGPKEISTPTEWGSLPPIQKDDLIAMPLWERSFLPLGLLDHLRASSGTSGKPPLFSPRTHVRGMEYRLGFHDFKRPFMSYTVPMMPHWHERFQREHGRNPLVVVYDPTAPEASARLARIAGVDALSLFVYHMPAAAQALSHEGLGENIRFIEITGEICTRALYEHLRNTFPHATIVQSYNSSEIEDAHIGMPCKPIDGSEPLAVYHPKESHYLEIIDPYSGLVLEPKAGTEGDLLITAYPGEPAAMPLLRFRIGDTVRIVEERCPHGSFSFTVLGRTGMDFLKVAGGVLRADEVARALRLFSDRVTDRFSLRVREVHTDRGPLLSPLLEVELKGTPNMEVLAGDIAAQLRIGPTMTWQRGVEEGRFLPLSCAPLSRLSGSKNRRIVLE